jgi:hypothetical protein
MLELMSTQPGADRIERAAFGFMASKVLSTAIEFGLFTELVKGPLDAEHVGLRRFSENALSESCQDSDGLDTWWTLFRPFFSMIRMT